MQVPWGAIAGTVGAGLVVLAFPRISLAGKLATLALGAALGAGLDLIFSPLGYLAPLAAILGVLGGLIAAPPLAFILLHSLGIPFFVF